MQGGVTGRDLRLLVCNPFSEAAPNQIGVQKASLTLILLLLITRALKVLYIRLEHMAP